MKSIRKGHKELQLNKRISWKKLLKVKNRDLTCWNLPYQESCTEPHLDGYMIQTRRTAR